MNLTTRITEIEPASICEHHIVPVSIQVRTAEGYTLFLVSLCQTLFGPPSHILQHIREATTDSKTVYIRVSFCFQRVVDDSIVWLWLDVDTAAWRAFVVPSSTLSGWPGYNDGFSSVGVSATPVNRNA